LFFKLTVWRILYRPIVQEAEEEFNEVRAMARNHKLTFCSKQSAVYHWRKHRDINNFNPLSAFDYFREANEVVAEGYLEENSFLCFHKQLSVIQICEKININHAFI
jgi:hypothetical protein